MRGSLQFDTQFCNFSVQISIFCFLIPISCKRSVSACPFPPFFFFPILHVTCITSLQTNELQTLPLLRFLRNSSFKISSNCLPKLLRKSLSPPRLLDCIETWHNSVWFLFFSFFFPNSKTQSRYLCFTS